VGGRIDATIRAAAVKKECDDVLFSPSGDSFPGDFF